MTADARPRRFRRARVGAPLALLLSWPIPAHAQGAGADEPEPPEVRGSGGGPLVVTREALGVDFQLCLPGVDHALQVEVVEEVFADLEHVEELVSNWSTTSAVSRLNADRTAGARALDPELAEVLGAARRFCVESHDCFDPTVGSLLDAMGTYARHPRALTEAEVAGLRESVGCGAFELGTGEQGPWIRRATADVVLDLSGVSKGWAVDRAVERLRARGVRNAFVAAGPSSVYALGGGPEGNGWDFEVPGPAGPAGEPVIWWLRDEAVSSSGKLSQPFDLGAGRVSHVLDPRTCRPVEHDLEATYFRGPSACEADMASTALLVMGADEAAAWFAERSDWARGRRALLVGPPRPAADGEVRRSYVELGGAAPALAPASASE